MTDKMVYLIVARNQTEAAYFAEHNKIPYRYVHDAECFRGMRGITVILLEGLVSRSDAGTLLDLLDRIKIPYEFTVLKHKVDDILPPAPLKLSGRLPLKIYIAGPYTTPDPNTNVVKAINAAEQIASLGHIPFIPHLTHFWHTLYPHEYEFWMSQDYEWLKVCDGLLRLPGESKGADKEVELAEQYGIPIYHAIIEIPPVEVQ